MSKIVTVVVVILIVIAGGWWYMSKLNIGTDVSPTNLSATTTGATSTSSQSDQQTGDINVNAAPTPAPIGDTSDATLTQDASNIDAQIGGLNTDGASVNTSLSSQ